MPNQDPLKKIRSYEFRNLFINFDQITRNSSKVSILFKCCNLLLIIIYLKLHIISISVMNKTTVNLLDLGSKARSKLELYRVLVVEGGLFLPPYKYTSIDADIIDERKKVGIFHCFCSHMIYAGPHHKRCNHQTFASREET